MRSVIEMKFAEKSKNRELVPPACTICFTEKEMNDESARNASRWRMNAYVCSYALHGQFAHTLLAREKKVGCFLKRPRKCVRAILKSRKFYYTRLFPLLLHYELYCASKLDLSVKISFVHKVKKFSTQ